MDAARDAAVAAPAAATTAWSPDSTRPIVSEHPEPEDGSALRLLDRELSWLSFNERVLALAARTDWPVLERARFLAIFATNLDEFFQVRVAGVMEQQEAGIAPFPGRLEPDVQLARILPEAQRLATEHARLYREEVQPAMARHGFAHVSLDELDGDDRAWLDERFESTIFPVLTPLAVDPAHPFPYLSNLSLNLAVLLRSPDDDIERFARVKVPPVLDRFVVLPDGRRFVALEDVIAGRLDRLFPGFEVVEHHVFRVTRDADLAVDGDSADVDDLMDAIESELSRRRRGQRTVRIEVDPTMPDFLVDLLLRELELPPAHVMRVPRALDLSGLWALVDRGQAPLTHEPFERITPRALDVESPRAFFGALRRRDVLVQHPYDDFDTTVLRFIEHAADDPDVLAVKLTLYRTSGRSPIIEALVRAAQRGTQVVALVELTARFDEADNIRWARRLEEAGAHVAYGVAGLKTHTKIALVVRREDDGLIRRYGHIGTGNYHERTARTYEDVGLLTADPLLCADLTQLFNALTGYGRTPSYRRLITAPDDLRPRILSLIAAERDAPDGHVVMKMNSLVDVDVIEALYDAAATGTRIDLVVRGICCLRPGVDGMSAGITVRSVVGRYLEHSRIYRFGSPARGFTHLIGSGDMMPRNLDHRVEAVVPVTDRDARARLDEILELLLADESLAWELGANGAWHRVVQSDGIDVHRELQQRARDRAAA